MLPARIPRPTALPLLDGLDLKAQYYSSRTGGDFFDAIAIGQHVVFLLTDVAGERASAHSIAASIQDTLHQHAHELFRSPRINMSEAIATLALEINRAIITTAHGVRFAPTFLACFDLSLGVLAYVNAGGQPAIFCDAGGTHILGNVTTPLGLFTHLTFEPGIQAFEPGSRLLLVTKGVLEARRGRDYFGVERVTDILQHFTADSALDLCRCVLQEAHQFRKLPWYDMQRLRFAKIERIEDLTAVSLVFPS
jgi:serine phosphatase RsbU (regulator of sigma subunit)